MRGAGCGKDMVRCADQSYEVGFADVLWLSPEGKNGFGTWDFGFRGGGAAEAALIIYGGFAQAGE